MSKTTFAWTLGLLLAGSMAGPAAAQVPSHEDLLNKLSCQPGQACETPAPAAQSAAPGSNAAGSQANGARLRTRGVAPPMPKLELAVPEIEKKASAGQLPTADIEVQFEFNSAALTPNAQDTLRALGRVLVEPKLAATNFVIIGHTDGKGTAQYNQVLSDKRAQAVREFLVTNFPIMPARLRAIGRGMTHLKVPSEPLAAVNRRVQVINVGQIAAR